MDPESPLEHGLFREAEDGATVFFPWGFSHRGYRLPDPAAKRKLVRSFSGVIAVVVAAGTWGGHRLARAFEGGAPSAGEALQLLALPLAIVALVLGGYALWVSRFVEACVPSDLQVSREERMRVAAEHVQPWKPALAGLGLAAMSAFLLVMRPETWVICVLGIALGGVAVAAAVVLQQHKGSFR